MIRPFGFDEFVFILSGAQWTLLLSLISFVGGGIGGIAVALARTSDRAWLRALAAGHIQIFQGTPLLVQLFFFYFGLPLVGLSLGIWGALIVGFSLHASAFLGEIWRGSIQAVPRGQTEAAEALGLGYVSRMADIVLPQAFRIALPATVGFLVNLVKGTALASLVGLTELTRSGQLMANITFQPLQTYAAVALVYFLLCFPLTFLSSRIEKRLQIGR